MKVVLIETKYCGKIVFDKGELSKLPKKLGLVTTVQFAHRLKEIKGFFKKNNKEIFTSKGRQPFEAQVLGCDVSSAKKIKNKVDAFLFVGDGSFHPMALAGLGKDIFVLNAFSGLINKIDKGEIEKANKRKKGAYLQFLSSENIGMLISKKPGQYYPIAKLDILKKKYKEKKFYLFISDALNYSGLDNFNFIESWVNTACPRIVDDAENIGKPILDIRDLLDK